MLALALALAAVAVEAEERGLSREGELWKKKAMVVVAVAERNPSLGSASAPSQPELQLCSRSLALVLGGGFVE